MSKILVVEDDPDIAELIRHYLEKSGHVVQLLSSGAAVMARLRSDRPELVVLDVMLPGFDGLMVCQAMRSEPRTAAIPIIMVTARGDEADRIAGLELGADDYVTKPFSPKELAARVGALLRRTERASPPGAVLRYGPITIDVDRHIVTVDDQEHHAAPHDGSQPAPIRAARPYDVRLTAKEFLLLQYLLEHRGRVLSRDLLLTDVWGYQYTGGTRTVDVHIRRLREKLPLLTDAIETVKQFGYKLVEG